VSARRVARIVHALETSDGAGVRLRRSLGQSPDARLDPFLMLDEFGSDDAADYIAGFPSHPHRGFETVTYMLEGRMLHEDHLGNRGLLQSGDVQWMSAARGIVHSEMPQQVAGRMRGFQLWLNLPAAEKMRDPAWRDVPARDLPRRAIPGGELIAIAGATEIGGERFAGAIAGASTDPLYLDLRLEADAEVDLPLARERNGLVYVYEGEVTIGDDAGKPERVAAHEAALLGEGGRLVVRSGAAGARVLVLAARPIGEPVVQHGPFVMNTREEIEEAIRDYAAGRLTS